MWVDQHNPTLSVQLINKLSYLPIRIQLDLNPEIRESTYGSSGISATATNHVGSLGYLNIDQRNILDV